MKSILENIKLFTKRYLRVHISFILSLIFLFFFIACIQKNDKYLPSDKPNIIIIIADDLGWADVGYHGSEVKTPNLDLLAETGVNFTQNYAMPTCTPTRVGLMTGKYPSRYGILAPAYGEVIDSGDPTLASILADNGYNTSIVGKWHLGSPPYTPLKYGFHTSYGYFDGQIDPYTHEYKNGEKSWHRNDQLFDEEGHATDLITNEAIRIINKKHDSPFFLYVAYSVPHYPLKEPEEWTSVYDNLDLFTSRKWFAGSITHMDNGIGKILHTLEKNKITENTIVLFISDNGGQFQWKSDSGYHGEYANSPHEVLGNNYPLRGWKGDVYEGGIRVPAILSWPGKLKAKRINVPVHIADWFPTLLNAIGYEKSLNTLTLDGLNMWDYFINEKDANDKRVMYWKTPNDYAIREGDWKLIVHDKTNEIELYNLKTDFREAQNLVKQNPEKTEYLLDLLTKLQRGDRERKK